MFFVDIIDAQGQSRRLSGEADTTIRDLAVAADVAGLMGECGGAMACGTCHIIISDDWVQQVGAAVGDEAVILDGTLFRHPNSRLACQMKLSASLNGLQAHVANGLTITLSISITLSIRDRGKLNDCRSIDF